VTYILPDGYRGIIKIRAERPTGTISKSENGDFVLTIPDSGELDIVEELPTKKWHQPAARYRNGQSIHKWQNGDGTPDNAIVLRHVTRLSPKEEWMVIGTLEDVRAALVKAYGFTTPRKGG
jgi:hypothetical protein